MEMWIYSFIKIAETVQPIPYGVSGGWVSKTPNGDEGIEWGRSEYRYIVSIICYLFALLLLIFSCFFLEGGGLFT